MKHDAIIIGKGPAGISAAIYLARAGYRVLVIGKGIGALERAEKIENYYGFPESLSGQELALRGIAQAERLGVEVRSEEAVSVLMEDGFLVRTAPSSGTSLLSETGYGAPVVLLATGKSRTTLNVPGFEEFRGKGISFCATCDGFFYRGKKLAVIGSGGYAASELSELLHFTSDITLFTDGKPLATGSLPAGVAVVTERITGFTGTDRLSGITTAGGESCPVDGAFVAVGTAGAADFAAKMGLETRDSDIVVDGDFRTNVPGIFAAGDCVGGYLQVAKAVSDGALAARSISSFLKELGKKAG